MQLQQLFNTRQRRRNMKKQRETEGESYRGEINSRGCMYGCRNRPFRWITVAQFLFHLTQGECLEGRQQIGSHHAQQVLLSQSDSDRRVSLNALMYIPSGWYTRGTFMPRFKLTIAVISSFRSAATDCKQAHLSHSVHQRDGSNHHCISVTNVQP